MKFGKSVALGLTALVSASTFAGTLTVPDQFTILYHNGAKVSSGIFSSTSEVELGDGQQNVIVVYEDVINSDTSDDHTVFKSQPFAVNFAANGALDYSMSFDVPLDEDQAKAFVDAPMIRLTDSRGQVINAEIKYQQNEEQRMLSSLSLGETEVNPALISAPAPVTTVTTTTVSTAPAAAATQAPAPVASSRPDAPADTQKAAHSAPQALDMLMFWWQQATPAQREQFKKAIAGQ